VAALRQPGRLLDGMPGYLDGYVERIAPAVERLQRVSLECMPRST
jgi:DNA adenine methylase